MVGMAVADSVGHMFEFLPIDQEGSRFDPKTLKVTGAYNKFKLKPGQWTDDTSMALCLADSLLVHNSYHGGDVRVRWHMWWEHGYCNAFRHDPERSRGRTSVGLGGNISSSLKMLEHQVHRVRGNHAEAVSPIYNSTSDDAGNGSIMRLAPVPIAFHSDESRALEVAESQSFASHP